MVSASYEEVVKLAEQLPRVQQDQLIAHLRAVQALEDDVEPTQNQLKAELLRLRTVGAFQHVDSLYGKFANPQIAEVSEADFHAQLHD